MKRLAELDALCREMGIDPDRLSGTQGRMDALRELIAKRTRSKLLPQIETMLARSLDDEAEARGLTPDWFLDNPDWVAEEKLDGCRFKAHATIDGAMPLVRMDSRRRSDQTFAFSEKTENFPHLTRPGIYKNDTTLDFWFKRWRAMAGTIFDGEVIFPYGSEEEPIDTREVAASLLKPGGVQVKDFLSASMVVSNSGPETSIALQKRYGPAIYVVFDLLFWAGQDWRDKPYTERREHLVRLIPAMNHPAIRLVRSAEDLKISNTEMMLKILDEGGEGIVLKHKLSPYESGKRSKWWLKDKREETHDGIITGWRAGQHGFTGLVGALEVQSEDGMPLAAVSSFPLVLRKEMSAPDGSLRPEYYDRWVEIKFQQKTGRSGRGRHARLIRFRPDR